MLNLLSRTCVPVSALLLLTAACENRRGNGVGVPDDAAVAISDSNSASPDANTERPDRAASQDVIVVANDVSTPPTDASISPPDTNEPVIDVAVIPPVDVPVTPPMDATTTTDVRGLPQRDVNVTPTSWSDCSQAAIFGMDGEACSFTGTCVECSISITPRTATCVTGSLRVAGANPAACGGARDGGVTRPDAGRDAGLCSPLFIEAPTPAQCSQTESDCLWGENTIGSCTSDTSTCRTCFTTEFFSCATQSGCSDELGARACCIAANCPDGSCAATTCATQDDAFFACTRAARDNGTCVPTTLCLLPQSRDAGAARDAGTCPPLAWPNETAPGCTAATLSCVDAATNNDEVVACLNSDTTGTPASAAGIACNRCVQSEAFACATDNGCDDELGLVDCCTDSACPPGSASTCTADAIRSGGACRTVWLNFIACSDAVPASSCPFPSVCFGGP